MSDDRASYTPSAADWRFVAWLSVAQLVSWGTLYYAFNVLLEPMQAELGWSRTSLTGAFSVGLLVAGVFGIPVGAWIDQRGGRWLMTGGSLLAAALLIAWSATTTVVVFYVVWALLGLSIATTLYEPGFAVVAARFGPAYRRGITVMTLLGGLASTAFIPLTQALVSSLGWRPTLLVLAAFNALVCGAVHFVQLGPARNGAAGVGEAGASRRDAVADQAASASATAPKPGATSLLRTLFGSPLLRAAMRRPAFWALFTCFTCSNLVVSGVAAHMLPLLQDRGATLGAAVAIAALFGPSQVAARLVTLGAERWLDARRLGRGATALVTLSVVALLGAIAFPPLLWAFPVLYGVGNGTMTIVRGTAVPDFISRTGYATINGALVMSTLLSRAAAPVATSLVWSAGGYDAVLRVFLALTLGAVAAFWAASAGHAATRLGAARD